MKKYLAETEALTKNPDDPEYRSWSHIRSYGVAGARSPKDPKEGNR